MSGLAVRVVREERRPDAPLFVHPQWAREYPWLTQGITSREAGNFSRFTAASAAEFDGRWRQLRDWTGARVAVLGRQVHGATVLAHQQAGPAGVFLADESDGHVTAAPDLLLAVSVADCVPVFIADAQHQTVAVLHAGWRGIAAGIARKCIEITGSNVHVHFGPAICGRCYEVGPEVHAALGVGVTGRHAVVDLRVLLAVQCVECGVPRDNITTSSWCTRCGDTPFYSHRAGFVERQVAVIGKVAAA